MNTLDTLFWASLFYVVYKTPAANSLPVDKEPRPPVNSLPVDKEPRPPVNSPPVDKEPRPLVNSLPVDEEPAEELWLEDFDTGSKKLTEDDQMQADSPLITDELLSDWSVLERQEPVASCPPPPKELPPFLCKVEQCSSDKDCLDVKGALCCYNGCKYTCLVAVQPLSYIDWKGQPLGRLPSGLSWLVTGVDERQEVDWCSTSDIYYEDEEPLLCPMGHVCHIDDPGNPAHGVPNRGRCVPAADQNGQSYRFITNISRDSCVIDNTTYETGSKFLYNSHQCSCSAGSVLCTVGRTTAAWNAVEA